MQSFRELSVWRKAHELTLAVYRVTKDFPGDERYGLTSQVRRAAASIGANIAEGCGRDGGPDFARFLQLAMGSASEVEYHLLLAHDLDLLTDETYENLNTDAIEVKRMLASLIKKVRNANRNSRTDN